MKIENIKFDKEKHLVQVNLNNFDLIPIIVKNEKDEIIKIGFKDKDNDRGIIIELSTEKIKELKDLL